MKRNKKREGLFGARIFSDGLPVHHMTASSFEDLEKKIQKMGKEKFL